MRRAARVGLGPGVWGLVVALILAANAVPPMTQAQTTPAKPAIHTVVLDPGHGGPEPGAADGGLVERDLNLVIALDAAEQMRKQGLNVVLTRPTSAAVNPDYVEPDRAQGRRDLQARVELANSANADVFISIHNNSSNDTSERGTEIWYDPKRPFADRNLALAQLALNAIVDSVGAAGYEALNRGVRDDAHYRSFRGIDFQLYVIGPGDAGQRPHPATQMPGILGETLFLSNPDDNAALRQPEVLHAIAGGYAAAVQAYFQQFG